MKRILCFVTCVILIALFVAPSVQAADNESAEAADRFVDAVNFTCVYDIDKRQVVIDGTVSHDFMISHGDYKIKVYSIMPGDSYESVLNDTSGSQLAESVMTVRFTFYIDVDSTLERYSKYVMIMSSPDGKNYLAGQPMLPSISSDFEYDTLDRSGFKGISNQSPVNIGGSGAGTVVVDVDIAKTVGDTSDSILYPMNDSYVHIRKSYIDQIDKQIQSAAVKESRVYIRLLMEQDGAYRIPDLHSEEVLDYVFTISGFLAERYDADNGNIRGMIVGIRIDDVEEANDIGELSLEEYAELYTLYLVVVGNAVRELRTDFDIVIPFSDMNDYSSDAYANNTICPSALLEQIIDRLDKNVSGTFNCSMMIESDSVPLNISEQSIGEGIKPDTLADVSTLGPDTVAHFLSYLQNLNTRYESVPSNVIYMWTVDDGMVGNALCCAYVYTYLRLIEYPEISSFVVSLGDASYESLRNVIRNIDTERANDVISPLARYFGVTSWDQIIGKNIDLPVYKYLFESNLFADRPKDIKGEFVYMDFTASSVYGMMSAGQDCEYIRSDHDATGTRSLCVRSAAMGVGRPMETIGIFEYPESYEYTQYLSLTVEVVDNNASAGSLYEITLTLGNKTAEAVAVGVVRNGEKQELYFNVEDFSDGELAEHIRVSARCLTGDTQGFSLWLHELKGHSTEYDSDTLKELIEARRHELRNEDVDGEGGFNYSVIVTVVGIVFAIAAVAIGLMIVFRRDDEGERDEQ